MKRRDLIKAINLEARARGVEAVFEEGGNHTKVRVAEFHSTIPRHREVAEPTAWSIFDDLDMPRRTK